MIKIPYNGHTYIVKGGGGGYKALCTALSLWLITPEMNFSREDALNILTRWRALQSL